MRQTRKNPIVRGSIALAIFIAAINSGNPGLAQDASTPPSVGVAPVTSEDVTRSAEFVGRVEAEQQVDVRVRIEGFLEEIGFEQGGTVTKGQTLYEIEPDPYQAALSSAQASLAAANASVSGAQAALKEAELDLERQKTLLQRDTVAQAVVDQAQAVRDQTNATLLQAQASVSEAEAAVKTAELNLSYATITSPIDGIIGVTNVTVGNLVSANSGILATVVQSDPIRVVFAIPERSYVEGQKLDAGRDIQETIIPTISLPDGTKYDKNGKIAFIDNRVDPNTGTISVRADFENPDRLLVPGQFVTVSVQLGESQRLPMIPASAVLQDREGPYVFVLGDDDTAQIRRITTFDRTATGWSIEDGLSEGETIIVNGLQRVRPGEKVTPQPVSASG